MAYFVIFVAAHKIKKLQLIYLVEGHTKFSPDRMFGSLSTRWKFATTTTTKDAATTLGTSKTNKNGENKFTSSRISKIFDWQKATAKACKKLPGISSYYNFEISTNDNKVKEEVSETCDQQSKRLDVSKKVIQKGFSRRKLAACYKQRKRTAAANKCSDEQASKLKKLETLYGKPIDYAK